MNRREFAVTGGSLLGLSAVGLTLADTSAQHAPSDTQRLYRRALVMDCSSAPSVFDPFPIPPSDLALYRSSGLSAVKSTIGSFDNGFELTLQEIARYSQLFEVHGDVFMQVRRAADFAVAKREGKIGIVFSFEGVEMLEGKIERIEFFRQLGVRVMQLSYNKTSPFGSGVLADADAPGLTPMGHSAVQKMNELGVAIDLSHAGPATTREAMAASTRPVLMTHAACSAVYPYPRHKTDDQLRALAEKGGVVGIYDKPYLCASPRQPTVEDYLAHLTHALKVCGEDHVGIGSDVGILPVDTSPEGLEAFRQWEERRHAAGV